VLCGKRKWGVRKRSEYIDRNNRVGIFMHPNSVMPNPNSIKFTMEVPSTQGRSHSKFKEDSFSHSQDPSNQTFAFFFFCTLCKTCYNLRMRVLIWLKFGTHIDGLKGNTHIKFGVNLINIQGVKSNFTHKAN